MSLRRHDKSLWITHFEDVCLQASTEDGKWRRGCDVLRQTVPYPNGSDWKSSVAVGWESSTGNRQLVRRSGTQTQKCLSLTVPKILRDPQISILEWWPSVPDPWPFKPQNKGLLDYYCAKFSSHSDQGYSFYRANIPPRIHTTYPPKYTWQSHRNAGAAVLRHRSRE